MFTEVSEVFTIVVVCSEVVHSSDPDITSLAVKNRALWLGTRNGYLLILDSYLMEEGKDPLLGLQHCGSGKVKCIVPLNPLPSASSKLQVTTLQPFTAKCQMPWLVDLNCLLSIRLCAVWNLLMKFLATCSLGSTSTYQATKAPPP